MKRASMQKYSIPKVKVAVQDLLSDVDRIALGVVCVVPSAYGENVASFIGVVVMAAVNVIVVPTTYASKTIIISEAKYSIEKTNQDKENENMTYVSHCELKTHTCSNDYSYCCLYCDFIKRTQLVLCK